MAISISAVTDQASHDPVVEPSFRYPTGSLLFVRHPTDEEMVRIRELSQNEISRTLAPMELVRAVYARNPDTFWGIFHSQDGTRARAQLTGYYSFLHLNDAGAAALDDGTFDGLNFSLDYLVAAGRRPAVMYVWAIVARKVSRTATYLVARALGRELYGGVPIYAKAATLGGVAACRNYGFESIRPSDKGLGDLYRLDPENQVPVTPAA